METPQGPLQGSDGPIALTNYYCTNPICAKTRAPSGQPHLLLRARLYPGTFIIVKCRHCRTWTTIQIPGVGPAPIKNIDN